MTTSNTQKALAGVVLIGLLAGGLACAHTEDLAKLEGTWDCGVSWTWDREGEPVPSSVRQRITCTESRLSSTGVISLGAAQWDETMEGTCHAEGDELYGTRSVGTVPRNDAARQFERDRLEGKSLGSTFQGPFRSRITSLTETRLTSVNEEGRVITCNRP